LALAKVPAGKKTAVSDEGKEPPKTSPRKAAAPVVPSPDDFSDDDFDEDIIGDDEEIESGAPVVASQQKDAGASSPVSMPIEEDLLQERMRVREGLPPLQEGDQFVVTDLEEFLASAGVGEMSAVAEIAPETPASVAPRGVDMDAVTPPLETTASDALDTTLPPEVAELLQKSAEKLNQGLSGKNEE
jgi:hypothetical protein